MTVFILVQLEAPAYQVFSPFRLLPAHHHPMARVELLHISTVLLIFKSLSSAKVLTQPLSASSLEVPRLDSVLMKAVAAAYNQFELA